MLNHTKKKMEFFLQYHDVFDHFYTNYLANVGYELVLRLVCKSINAHFQYRTRKLPLTTLSRFTEYLCTMQENSPTQLMRWTYKTLGFSFPFDSPPTSHLRNLGWPVEVMLICQKHEYISWIPRNWRRAVDTRLLATYHSLEALKYITENNWISMDEIRSDSKTLVAIVETEKNIPILQWLLANDKNPDSKWLAMSAHSIQSVEILRTIHSNAHPYYIDIFPVILKCAIEGVTHCPSISEDAALAFFSKLYSVFGMPFGEDIREGFSWFHQFAIGRRNFKLANYMLIHVGDGGEHLSNATGSLMQLLTLEPFPLSTFENILKRMHPADNNCFLIHYYLHGLVEALIVAEQQYNRNISTFQCITQFLSETSVTMESLCVELKRVQAEYANTKNDKALSWALRNNLFQS